MFPARNQKFETYIAPATHQAEPWRAPLAIGIFLGLLFGLANIFAVLSPYIIGFFWPESDAIPPQVLVITALAIFPAVLLVFWASIRLVHGHGVGSLVSPSQKMRWGLFFKVVLLVILVSILLALPDLFRGGTQQQLSVFYWLAWAAPACLLIFVQAFTEELIFRGYLLQQFAIRFKSRWVWWLGPAVLFGALHYNPETYGQNAWLVVVTATFFGLILADVTIRTGNLTIAIALHFANNFVLLLVFGTAGQLSALSLFLRDIDLQNPDQARAAFLVTLAAMVFAYLIYILVIRQRR